MRCILSKIRRHPTHSELNSYLDNIESGSRIDLKRFKLLLVRNHINLNDFSHFYGYAVECLSEGMPPKEREGWATWRQSIVGRAIDLTDKVTAASTGNSHSVSNKNSMIPCWPSNGTHPVLAYFNGSEWNLPYLPTSDLLVLENEALFLMRAEMTIAIAQWFPDSISNIDWAFSSGNAMSSKVNKGFLQQYSNIHVLTDIDLGGLKIFLNLQSLMSDSGTTLKHVFPESIATWLKEHGHPISLEYKNTIKKIIPSLSGSSLIAAREMIQTGLAMEQEALLRKNND